MPINLTQYSPYVWIFRCASLCQGSFTGPTVSCSLYPCSCSKLSSICSPETHSSLPSRYNNLYFSSGSSKNITVPHTKSPPRVCLGIGLNHKISFPTHSMSRSLLLSHSLKWCVRRCISSRVQFSCTFGSLFHSMRYEWTSSGLY